MSEEKTPPPNFLPVPGDPRAISPEEAKEKDRFVEFAMRFTGFPRRRCEAFWNLFPGECWREGQKKKEAQ